MHFLTCTTSEVFDYLAATEHNVIEVIRMGEEFPETFTIRTMRNLLLIASRPDFRTDPEIRSIVALIREGITKNLD